MSAGWLDHCTSNYARLYARLSELPTILLDGQFRAFRSVNGLPTVLDVTSIEECPVTSDVQDDH